MRLRKLIALLAVALSLPLTGWADQGSNVPTIYCGVYKSDAWGQNPQRGIYTFKPSAPVTFTKQSTATDDRGLAALGGAAVYDGVYHAVNYTSFADPMSSSGYSYYFTYYEYDTKTWNKTSSKYVNYDNISARCNVAIDPVSGKVYGLFNNFDLDYNVVDRKWATIDYSTQKKTVIDAMTLNLVSIAISNEGQCYGIATDSKLYKIKKEDGTYQTVGPTGITVNSGLPMSAAFDPQSDVMYWAAQKSDGTSGIYTLNLNTGAATLVGSFPNNEVVVNMWIPKPAANADAPAAVSNLSANFPGESLTGSFSLTLPSQTYGGGMLDPLNSLSIHISESGRAISGYSPSTELPGNTVTVSNVTVPAGGEKTFTIYVSNDDYDGAKIDTTFYVGPDYPTAPLNARLILDRDAQKAHLSWTAPTVGQHGIVFDPNSNGLSYKIVRQPGNVTVGTVTGGATIYDDNIDLTGELRALSYDIIALNGTLTGDTAKTNKAIIGDPLAPPYTENFSRESDFDFFTVIDNNNDGATWKYRATHYTYTSNEQFAAIDADNNNADDDYLLTPPIKLEKGATYLLDFRAKKQYSGSNYNQKMDVLVGTGDDVTLYNKVMTGVNIDEVNNIPFDSTFTVPSDGVYHIAFHALSNAASAELQLDSIKLTVLTSGQSPEACADFIVTPDANGALKADFGLVAPSKTLHGDDLPATLSRVDILMDDSKVVATRSNVQRGAVVSWDKVALSAGKHKFTARAVSNGLNSVEVSDSAFIGLDRPQEPTSLTLTDNGVNPVLTWANPTESANGLRFNADSVKINLYNINSNGTISLLQPDVNSPYTIESENTQQGDQRLLYYALDAETNGGKSLPVATGSIVAGTPYELPYRESFGTETSSQFIWFEGIDAVSWNFSINTEEVQDSDGRSLQFIPIKASSGSFNLAKLSLQNAQQPELTFWYYPQPGATASIIVSAVKAPQNDGDIIKTVNFANETTAEWKRVDVDLSAYKSEPYVVIKFLCAAPMNNEKPKERATIVIDNVQVYDATTTAISELHNSSIVRADGTVDMDALNSQNVSIYTLSGAIVATGKSAVNSLSQGVYVVRTATGEVVKIKK